MRLKNEAGERMGRESQELCGRVQSLFPGGMFWLDQWLQQ